MTRIPELFTREQMEEFAREGWASRDRMASRLYREIEHYENKRLGQNLASFGAGLVVGLLLFFSIWLLFSQLP